MKKFISIVMTVIIALSGFNCVYAKSISELNKERNSIKSKSESTKQNLQVTQNEKSQVLAEVEKLDRELNQVQEELNKLTQQLEDTKVRLQNSEVDLENAIEDKENQYETLKKRIRVMYENGSIGYLQIILDAESFSDFLKRIEYINKIMEYDQDVFQEYQKTEETIKVKVEDIKVEKADIEVLTAKQADKKHALDENIKVKEELVKKLSSEEATYLQQISDLEQADKDIADLITKAQAKAAAEAAAKAKAAASANKSSSSNSTVYAASGGKFQYPVPAYRGVNSGYGYRSSPISGRSEFHTGLDLRATMGTDVVAAESGVIIYSGNKGGYGKTIIIDHGNGVSTLYAHNSSLVVSVGQSVKRGQVVSKAGTTGYSTGVHLHFEVRINGKHTNPTSYILG